MNKIKTHDLIYQDGERRIVMESTMKKSLEKKIQNKDTK